MFSVVSSSDEDCKSIRADAFPDSTLNTNCICKVLMTFGTVMSSSGFGRMRFLARPTHCRADSRCGEDSRLNTGSPSKCGSPEYNFVELPMEESGKDSTLLQHTSVQFKKGNSMKHSTNCHWTPCLKYRPGVYVCPAFSITETQPSLQKQLHPPPTQNQPYKDRLQLIL